MNPPSKTHPADALARALKASARRLGAGLVGVAPAALPDGEGGPDAYLRWLERGMHARMGYLSREPLKRAGVRAWFAPARSVLLCAFAYPAQGAKEGRGARLARYAGPKDYHGELRARMGKLLEEARELEPGLDGKVFVDTSAVLERLYARYAGLGWVGKNTMLLSGRLGSFFFLAGLAVDRELPADAPMEEHCGSCTRCLDACPTGAFPTPRVLDARRCIAYHTIESRDAPVPEDLRPGFGDWVFGCDICQDVCPFNRFAPAGALAPSLPLRQDLEALAALSPEGFAARFKGTPLRRTGHAALLRNVLLAMGNSGDPRYRGTLERFAAHGNPLLAEQARWSLTRLVEP